MPRIIAGTRKKMNLLTPAGNETRPTTDRVKENVFNIIGTSIIDADFLDLFSGSGQIGLEALSRSANKCVFVENSKKTIDILKKNIEKTKFTNTEILNMDSLYFIDSTDRSFDIIYVDPPYSSGLYDKILIILSSNNVLKSDGIILVEHDLNVQLLDIYGILERYKSVRYGNTIITIYRKR